MCVCTMSCVFERERQRDGHTMLNINRHRLHHELVLICSEVVNSWLHWKYFQHQSEKKYLLLTILEIEWHLGWKDVSILFKCLIWLFFYRWATSEDIPMKSSQPERRGFGPLIFYPWARQETVEHTYMWRGGVGLS